MRPEPSQGLRLVEKLYIAKVRADVCGQARVKARTESAREAVVKVRAEVAMEARP